MFHVRIPIYLVTLLGICSIVLLEVKKVAAAFERFAKPKYLSEAWDDISRSFFGA